ncbi:glycosyltransferase family 4 protein [Dongia sp.]|uniref:glycosyltransferase family 4 protein n=1 Tax=Dongia sp. TaxID=1977262 RepID=UPI0035B1E2C3
MSVSLNIAIVTDAWAPQTNGVVRTIGRTMDELVAAGHRPTILSPQSFRSLPCPTYPEIRLSLFPYRRLAARLDALAPNAIHIATEGPLGLAARRYCLKRGLPFTTAYHTRFPEYIAARFGLPLRISYAWLRRFHAAAQATMVATPSIEADLRARGFMHIKRWSRGVDTRLFRPRPRANALPPFADLPHPIHLYVGRLAVEKNIEAFLQLDLPGSQVVVGDGPLHADLKARFPGAIFLGQKVGEDLAQLYAAADVFVFPSLTDTFGLVILEALASGVPVAAFPVAGPKDILQEGVSGALDRDLGLAIARALKIPRMQCRTEAERFSWRAATEQFLSNLVLVPARLFT